MTWLHHFFFKAAIITTALMIGADGVTSAQTNPTPVNLVSAKPLVGATTHTDGRGTPKLVFPPPGGAPSVNDRQAADNFIKAHYGDFKLSADISNLELISTRESLLGTHYRYRQMLNDVPIEGAEIVVSISNTSGEIYQAYNNTYPVNATPVVPKALIGGERALDSAWNHLRVHGRLLDSCRKELVYIPVKGGFRLVYKTYVAAEAPFGYWEHQIDAVSGEVVAVRDMAIRMSKGETQPPDFSAYTGPIWPRAQTTREWETVHARRMQASAATKNTVNGTARVFDPDPRTALADETLKNSSSASAFTNAYVTRTLRDISETGGVYSLDGPWVKIIDFESPTDAPSTTSDGKWTASRGNNAFNDVMTYFHIDQSQRYLQSLGFIGSKGIEDAPIEADSNANEGGNSFGAWYVNHKLKFAHALVDANEDADVILHEYGHAITYDIVANWGSGGDSRAIGEGFGDYWGASYSYTTINGKTFHPEWAASWFGHSADTWSGRFLNKTDLTYDPNHTNGEYLHGQYTPGCTWNYVDHETISGISDYSDQLWSTPLFQSFLTLVGMGYPRTDVDKIVIESYFGLGGNPTMREMATATVNAAELLFPAGSHADVFREKFSKQGILSLPFPAVSANYSSLVLNPGQQQTITFTIKNSGAATGNLGGYLSISLSSGLDIVGTPTSDNAPIMQYSHKQPGDSGWDKSQHQITLSYELQDAYQTYSAGETRKIYVTVKANTSSYGSQWIKYRATFNDSQNHYVNDPSSGGTDQQGWYVYRISVDGGSLPGAGNLLVNGSSSPSPWGVSATEGSTLMPTISLSNSGESSISVTSSKSGGIANWITLPTPNPFTILGKGTKDFIPTITVPGGTSVGTYSGAITFTYNSGANSRTLPINITVNEWSPGLNTVTLEPSCGFRSCRGLSRAEGEGQFGPCRGPSERSDAELLVV